VIFLELCKVIGYNFPFRTCPPFLPLLTLGGPLSLSGLDSQSFPPAGMAHPFSPQLRKIRRSFLTFLPRAVSSFPPLELKREENLFFFFDLPSLPSRDTLSPPLIIEVLFPYGRSLPSDRSEICLLTATNAGPGLLPPLACLTGVPFPLFSKSSLPLYGRSRDILR